MRRILLVVLFTLLGFWTQSSKSEACSCAKITPASYIHQASAVYFARVVSIRNSADKIHTKFDVLLALKGPAKRKFVWRRSKIQTPCHLEYKKGELALLFVDSHQHLDLCNGNFKIGTHAREFEKYLKAARVKFTPATKAEVKSALEVAMKGYLHQRSRIPAQFSPLKGESVSLGTTLVEFVENKSNAGDSISIDLAIRFGPWVFFRGYYSAERLRIEVLLRATKKGFVLANNRSREGVR